MADFPLVTSPLSLTNEEILNDYRLAYMSRQVSIIGRREVLSGKAKFGIFGAGKELPQVALGRSFRNGDFRSGYYRDQTLMVATGMLTWQEFFAQLYAHTDLQAEPATGGRAMTAHFASRSLNPDGSWKDLTAQPNSAADLSPTGAQMPRLVGLGLASRLYREVPELRSFAQFSQHGDEVAFGIIGNASCAEGLVWEAINAIGVLRVPVVLTIYDDGYGISVPNDQQMVLESMSQLLKGFQREPGCHEGYDVYIVHGWDYPALVTTYQQAVASTRREHVPAVVHVIELTQPGGHSTSGSHERYKTPERLDWEEEFDGLSRFRAWIISEKVASPEELDILEEASRLEVEEIRKRAWEAYLAPVQADRLEAVALMDDVARESLHAAELSAIRTALMNSPAPLRRDILTAIRDVLLTVKDEPGPAVTALIAWKERLHTAAADRYGSHLYSQSAEAACHVPEVAAVYSENSPVIYGFEVLNACFDAALRRDPRVVAFGEDVGKLGDVNQGFRGLQDRYGALRVGDTGIREATIVGQAIGLAMRGLRPIAEVQYLDYVLYALQIMSDDLASLHWRTKGGQKAPVIVRTRGHRLEGIWHAGSPMAAIIHLVRGMHVLTPRNMTQAAGFYNMLLRSDEPALIVEVLNGYRLKERLPDNVGEFTVPLGVPEVLRPGADLTIVTYGACCRIALDAAALLARVGIDAEIVDVQSLLPFDVRGVILESLKKTSRILFVDEDVPGGTTAYMFQKVIEEQGGYSWLDSSPQTLAAQPHRPAYGSDGDYWSKPNADQIFEAAYEMIHEAMPGKYPLFYRSKED